MNKKKSFILIGIGIILVAICAFVGNRYISTPKLIDKTAVIQKIDTSRYFSEEEINQAVDTVIQSINSTNQIGADIAGYVDLLEVRFDRYETKEGIRLLTTVTVDGSEIDWSWDLKKTSTGWEIENAGAG